MNALSSRIISQFSTNVVPWYVEESGLEEEEEDHPLVVLVVDNITLLPRFKWSHPRVRLIQSNLVVLADTVLILGCSESVMEKEYSEEQVRSVLM